MPRVRIKRAYDPPSPDDGCRILVDRLWPRGLSRDTAGVDLWLKELAPSAGLRRWFGHDPARWTTFAARYRGELLDEPAAGALDQLAARAAAGPVTLLFAARDTSRNNAVVLREVLTAP